MAALKQPTSFNVVKLVEGNAASRSGQPGEGRRGSGKKRRHLHGSDVWDQNTRCGKGGASTLGLIRLWFQVQVNLYGNSVVLECQRQLMSFLYSGNICCWDKKLPWMHEAESKEDVPGVFSV